MAPVSDKPTIRELQPDRKELGVRGNLFGIAGDKVESRNGQGREISGPGT